MINEDQSNFEYRTLETGSRQIRLIELRQPTDSTDVDCGLEYTSLNENPAYEALSYTWGDPSGTAEIKVNGLPFPVSRNLAICLQEWRRKDSGIAKLWIDAVCINQKDDEEKSLQVLQMKQIYENASKIVVWLGEESDDSSYAMDSMAQIEKLSAMRPERHATKNVPKHLLEQILDQKAKKALSLILRRPWWRRAWIIQEATCPNNVFLRCGRNEVGFKAVVASVRFILEHKIRIAQQQDFSNPDVTDLHRVIAMDQIRFIRSENGQMDILSLLDQSRKCEASDPRDKLFALSGLTKYAQKEAVNPDYSLRLDKVFARFTYTMIKIEKNLDIFGHCQELEQIPLYSSALKLLRPSQMPDRPLPSWTPDWTLELEATPFFKNEIENDTSSSKLYRSSNDYPPFVQPSEDLRILFVRGFPFDKVSELGPDFGVMFGTKIVQRWYSWALTKLGKMYHASGTTHEAALHTFIADIGIINRRCRRGSTAPWPVTTELDTNKSFLSNSLVKMALSSRGFFISKLGYMGLARYDVKVGDEICILHGGQVPFILRQQGKYHQFKGECYVHGIMDGEAMRYPTIWRDFALR